MHYLLYYNQDKERGNDRNDENRNRSNNLYRNPWLQNRQRCNEQQAEIRNNSRS